MKRFEEFIHEWQQMEPLFDGTVDLSLPFS